MSFASDYNYSWEWHFFPSSSGKGAVPQPPRPPKEPKMPPHPGDNGDDDEYAKYRRDGFDLSPTSFQDYLLDLVNLSSIATSVGELSEVAHTPVANWLRTQGLQLLYSDTDGLYILLYDRGQQAGQRYGVLPDYLVRYLELLVDDAFADAVVPAYQALALLTYVVTTERHRLRSGT